MKSRRLRDTRTYEVVAVLMDGSKITEKYDSREKAEKAHSQMKVRFPLREVYIAGIIR